MFQATRAVFFYAISPVHMGAGSAIGAIDSPIQREVHTGHPMFAGAGLKGALRHHFNDAWPRGGADGRKPHPLIARIFGPDTNESDFAGALALGDAQLVALPVQCARKGFAYATSPIALARARRLLGLAGCQLALPGEVPADGEALVADEGVLTNGRLLLETYDFRARVVPAVASTGNALASWAMGNEAFFAGKLEQDLVILSDTDFAHLARQSMVVEPHVRIDDESGTASGGGLFYVENLPPESLMVALAYASAERGPVPDGQPRLDATAVLEVTFDGRDGLPGIHGGVLQVGGDASTGRGLVQVRTCHGKG